MPSRALLSELLPLRASSILGSFDKNEQIQLAYGDLTASPTALVRLDDVRYVFSDGSAEVTGVLVDREETDAYEVAVQVFAGAPATIITLSAPPPEGAVVTAYGKGRRSRKTGELIESPADILEDLLLIAGYVSTPGLDDLRAETKALRLARAVPGGYTLRYWLDNLMTSIGGFWTPRHTGLYPPISWHGAPTIAPTLSPLTIELTNAVVDSDDYRSQLLVGFSYSTGLSRFDQALTLKARLSPFDVEPQVNNEPYDCGWIRSPNDALAVGKRLLSRYVTDRVRVQFKTNHPDVIAGALLEPFEHPRVPGTQQGSRPIFILNVTHSLVGGVKNAEGEVLLRDPEIVVDVVSRSVGFVKPQAAALEVIFKNGIATFAIIDENNAAVVDAFVALDNGVAKRTDAEGRVSFEAAAGQHVVAVQKEDYQPFEIEITL
jgi:hypothetical protein